MEGRALGNNTHSKGNVKGMTETLSKTETILNRISWLSTQNRHKSFGSLMHLYNPESLKQCYLELQADKAIGIDGMNKKQYGENLKCNIDDLTTRMKRMAYRPGPVRQVLIPKEGKPGATRPLGISNFEDKIIQKMTQKILEAIYEPTFLESSHGFRPKRGCHTAIKHLMDYLYHNEVETIVDIDLKNFFGTIDHKLIETVLRERINDATLMRYIVRMFKAGVLAQGEMSISEEGVPQGSICSPILSNIFAHYVLDTWIEEVVKPHCKGKVALIRYADDAVICCEKKEEAIKIKKALAQRLAKYKLQLNEEKTKLVAFSKRKASLGIKQGTFDFLGFTFYLGYSQGKRVIPKLKTRSKTFRAKFKKVKEWVKQERHSMPMKDLWKKFCKKLEGHVGYYGVSHNSLAVQIFLQLSGKIFYKWMNRRSQKKSFDWEKFNQFIKQFPMPRVRIIHSLF